MLLLGGDVDEHQGLAVAAQAVLEEVGELRVAVGNVRVLLGERHDDVAEVGQRLYFTLFPKSFVCSFTHHPVFVKLRQGSGKDRQGMALKAKGLKA